MKNSGMTVSSGSEAVISAMGLVDEVQSAVHGACASPHEIDERIENALMALDDTRTRLLKFRDDIKDALVDAQKDLM